jgi:cell division topological specificity factor
MGSRDHDLRSAERARARLHGCGTAFGRRSDRDVRPISSAPVARERLQMLLEYERDTLGQNDLITVLREEIVGVVSRHVRVDPDKVRVSVDRRAKVSTLAVGVKIPEPAVANALSPTAR